MSGLDYLAAATAVLLAFWATVVLALARTAAAADGRLGGAGRVAPSPLDDRLGVVDHGAVVEHQRGHHAVAGQLLYLAAATGPVEDRRQHAQPIGLHDLRLVAGVAQRV